MDDQLPPVKLTVDAQPFIDKVTEMAVMFDLTGAYKRMISKLELADTDAGRRLFLKMAQDSPKDASIDFHSGAQAYMASPVFYADLPVGVVCRVHYADGSTADLPRPVESRIERWCGTTFGCTNPKEHPHADDPS